MPEAIEAIDIKECPGFLEQYVALRNRYIDLLVTDPVSVEQTKRWLARSDIEVRGLAYEGILLGAVILYASRENEIAFFVKEPNKGIGSRLLDLVEQVAIAKKLDSVWAWVLDENNIAKRVFEKKGFYQDGIKQKDKGAAIKTGIVYRKKICYGA